MAVIALNYKKKKIRGAFGNVENMNIDSHVCSDHQCWLSHCSHACEKLYKIFLFSNQPCSLSNSVYTTKQMIL